MKWFFDMENPVMRALSTVADLIILNLLTLLCSLPIVTAGAAIIAMNAVSIRIIRNEDGNLLKDYFHAFAANWKKGTALWLLALLCAVLLIADYFAAKAYISMLCPVIAAMGVLVLTLAIYAFALLARYENTLGGTLKNAVSLAVGFFPRTLGMVLFTLIFWLLTIQYLRFGAPVLLMFGLSLPCYVCVLLMNPIFIKIENK
ncbi:MAG: YesL family protein [Faecousia sp.]